MMRNLAQNYRTVDLNSANKTDILDRLYTRLLSDLEGANAAILSNDVGQRADLLDHAGRIVTEFVAALDHNTAPELCGKLASLYGYITDCINTANTQCDRNAIENASTIVTHLRESFRLASTNVSGP